MADNKKNNSDAFSDLGETLADFFNRYWQVVLGAAFAVVVVWGGLVAYHLWDESQEKAAQEKLFTLSKSLTEKQKELNKDEKKQPEYSPAKLKENFSTIIADYQKFIAENENRNAGAMAAIELAGLASLYKDWETAIAALREVTGGLKPGSLFYGLVHGQAGTVQIELGQYEEAIKHFDMILSRDELKYAHAETLLRKAAAHIELKQWDQAESALAKIDSEFAASQSGMMAKGLKRLLLLRKAEG